MRVLLVNDGLEPEYLSVVRLVREQARDLVRRGHDVALLGTVRDRDKAGEREHEGVHEVRLATSYPLRFRNLVGLRNPQTVGPFERFLGRFRPDVVHFHNVHTWISFAAVRSARRHGARTALTAHDVMLFWGGKLAPYDASTTLEEVVGGRVDYQTTWLAELAAERLRWVPFRRLAIRRLLAGTQIVAVSDALREALRQNGFESETVQNRLAPDALDVSPEKVRAFRERYGLEGHPVVLFGGRLSALKGDGPMLDALARLRRPDVLLLVFGGGADGWERAFEQRVEALGLSRQIRRTGWLTGDELRCAYHACDVAVNPSLCFETLSMFNLEASLAGKPVLSTFFGGASETVLHGETGLLINPYDSESLCQGLGRLLEDPQLASKLGGQGQAMVRECFAEPNALERALGIGHAS